MPAPVVERPAQHVEQAAAAIGVGRSAFAGDAVLQHAANDLAVLLGPGIETGVEQAFAGRFQADRCALAAFRQRLPDQAELDAGGGRTNRQLGVDRRQAPLGILQQTLDRGRHFSLQMVFQYFRLTRRQQLAPLGDFLDDAPLDQVGPFGPVLVDDGDDQPEVGGVGLGLVPQRSQRRQQLRIIARNLVLQAGPVGIFGADIVQAVLGTPGHAQGRFDAPWRRRHVQFGQGDRQQTGPGEIFEAVDRQLACRAALSQGGGAVFGALLAARALLTGQVQGIHAGLLRLFAVVYGAARGGETPFQFLDLGADRLAQHLQAGRHVLEQGADLRQMRAPRRAATSCAISSKRATWLSSSGKA